MKTLENLKLLKNLINIQDKQRFYSTNTYRQYNTYKCKAHNDFYDKICLKCYMDICPKCEKNFHRTHQTIKYEEIFPDNFEIQNLQSQINIYLDALEFLKKELNNWYNGIKEKMECFEQIFKNNEVLKSYDLIMNYSSKNIICLDTIYKFRKIYFNLIDDDNTNNDRNRYIFLKISNYENESLPIYLNFQEIKKLIQNLKNIDKENVKPKNDLMLNYLFTIPSDVTNNSSEKYNSLNNYKISEYSASPIIEKINSNSLCDKSTGYDIFKTKSEIKISDIKKKEFKKIINKTIITDFNIENPKEIKNYNMDTESNIKNIFSQEGKKYNIPTLSKYLNKMGFINTNIDLKKVNSSQNLLNKSSISIKSTKYVNVINLKKSDSTTNFIYKKQNNIQKLSKSAMNSPKVSYKDKNNYYSNNPFKKEISIKGIDYNNKNWYNHPLLTSKKIQKKSYVHKKFKYNNQSNELYFTEIKKDNDFKSKFTQNTNQNMNKMKKYNKELKKEETIYEKPIKQELFKYNTINNIKNNMDESENINEQNSMKIKNESNLLNLIYSPSINRNKSNTNNRLTKINKLNLSFNSNLKKNLPSTKIIKTNITLDNPLKINPKKALYLGLELSDSECKLCIINQKTNDIQILNNFEDNDFSIPVIVSFSENKKEIKIGNAAKKDILKNPSQTIFNLIKFFGKKMKDIKYQSELLPFKIYSTNNEEDKPYIKVNFGPQKDKVIFFEKILIIFLQKVFENFIKKIKLEQEQNNLNVNIKIVLSISVPNYFTYYQRKLLEDMFKKEIISTTNENNNMKFDLDRIYLKNSSNIASLCINYDEIKTNVDNNILILNIDKGNTNISLVSLYKKKNGEKKIIKVKASCGIEKGINNLLEDFMIYIINNRLDLKTKNEIIKSPSTLVKMRYLCKKIKQELLSNDKAYLNMKEIVSENDLVVGINKNEYENILYNFVYDLKHLIIKMIENNNLFLNNFIINEIFYIGDIFKDKKISMDLEQILKQKNLLSKNVYAKRDENLDKVFYGVGGASLFAVNKINDKNNLDTFQFQDISQFNIGIKQYNGTLNYLIKNGDLIPFKNTIKIKIGKSSEIQIYEEDNQTKNKRLIGIFDLDSENIINSYYKENNFNYIEIMIEYEFDEELNFKIKILEGEKFSKELNCKLLLNKS